MDLPNANEAKKTDGRMVEEKNPHAKLYSNVTVQDMRTLKVRCVTSREIMPKHPSDNVHNDFFV